MPTGSLSTILKAIFGGNVAALMVEIVLKLWHTQRSKSTRISEMTENLRLVHRLFEDIHRVDPGLNIRQNQETDK